jgi:NAD(P)-dependent dehydrogenase (short-subunit alcohol dehydrogenase family)
LTAYLVTGGTGFIGRYLLGELVKKKDAEVFGLVRPESKAKLAGWGKKVIAVEGDIGKKGLGISAADRKRLTGAEVFHLAAVYDLEAPEDANQHANVEGTRNVVAFANTIKAARIHHVSSIAVAGGSFKGEFTEDTFAAGQELGQPYYRTKYEAEKIVRSEAKVPIRVYRPAIVIGSSEDGQADRVDGIYYSFKIIQRLRDALPPWVPLVGVEGGRLNLVPVDYVARALAHIASRPGLDGQTFHLVDPSPSSFGDTLNIFCRAAHAPQFTLRIDSRAGALLPGDLAAMLESWKVFQTVKRQVLEGVNVPEAALSYASNRTRFTCRNAETALEGSGIEVPPLNSYAWKVWDYYERHLDPQAPTPPNFRAALQGKVAVVTGASSGIGRATAAALARHGAEVILVSRSKEKLEELRGEIAAGGGTAYVYPCDLSDLEAIDRLVADVLKDRKRIDILVNNAGRSIRRSIHDSLDRFHDFQRTMQLNYFGAVRLLLAILPGMKERKEGHILNVSSIGVQAYPPRFGAYVASKSALAALSRCLGPEVADDGIAVTNIHMPLVRTPMIAPTGMYESFPTISSDEAADMVLAAVLTRVPEVSTRLGKLAETVDVVAPGLLHLVMTGAYHVFPDSAGKDGAGKGAKNGRAKGKPKPAELEEISPEGAAMAFLMKGIHF